MSRAASSRPPAQDDSDDDTGSSIRTAAPPRPDPKGDEFRLAAEKRLKSFSFFSGSAKYEDAVELYEKAAAQYKMSKNWAEAGAVYRACAELYRDKLKEPHDESVAYENAAKAFKNVDTREALKCYGHAVELLMENNKFSMAAKIWKEMGSLQEKEHDTRAAINSFQKAGDCYEADNSQANTTAMLAKVAALSADAGDYKKAIQIWEKISKSSLENSALRWSVKDYLFRALLCHFVLAAPSHQLDGVSAKLEQYVDMCPAMDGTREKALIEDLVNDFADQDPDAFADHVFRFDEIQKLDNWTAKVLLEIKKALEQGDPEPEGVGV